MKCKLLVDGGGSFMDSDVLRQDTINKQLIRNYLNFNHDGPI